MGGILGLALLVVLLYILYKRMQPRETGTYDPPLAGSMEGPQAGALRASLKQYVRFHLRFCRVSWGVSVNLNAGSE